MESQFEMSSDASPPVGDALLCIDHYRHFPLLCSGAVRIKSVDPLLPALARSPRIMTRMNRIARTICQLRPSVLDFSQTNDDPGRLGLMCGHFRKACIAPISQTYELSFLGFHPGNFEQLQYIQPHRVEEEGMLPEQLAELCNRWMVVSEHLRSKLRQCFGYLDVVQLHGLFLIFGNRVTVICSPLVQRVTSPGGCPRQRTIRLAFYVRCASLVVIGNF